MQGFQTRARPLKLGRGNGWLAVAGPATHEIAQTLPLLGPKPADWLDGLSAANGTSVFVSPPVHGPEGETWTLIAGLALPTFGWPFETGWTVDRITPLLAGLSRRHGTACYFGDDPGDDVVSWARAEDGKLTRSYGFSPDVGTLWSKGEETEAEAELDCEMPPVSDGVEPFDAVPWSKTPARKHLYQLAAEWSIDPNEVMDAAPPGLGLVGDLGPEFHDLSSLHVRYREYWRLAGNALEFFLAAAVKTFRVPMHLAYIPAPDSGWCLEYDDLPELARQGMQEWRQELEAAGFSLGLSRTVPTLENIAAYGSYFTGDDPNILAILMCGLARNPAAGFMRQDHVTLISRDVEGVLLSTSNHKREFDTPPTIRSVFYHKAPVEVLIEKHQERLANWTTPLERIQPSPEGLERFALTLEEVDHRSKRERGLLLPVDRTALRAARTGIECLDE